MCDCKVTNQTTYSDSHTYHTRCIRQKKGPQRMCMIPGENWNWTQLIIFPASLGHGGVGGLFPARGTYEKTI